MITISILSLVVTGTHRLHISAPSTPARTPRLLLKGVEGQGIGAKVSASP